MEYYTFSQGFTKNNDERVPRDHHVKSTRVTKERYESDEEEEEEQVVNKLVIKEVEEDEETSTTMLTSKVRYLNYQTLKHDSSAGPAGYGGGGRVLPPPSNKYHRGHPMHFRCRS
ncbi:unnamed protein product [Cochlearia groenlandica]